MYKEIKPLVNIYKLSEEEQAIGEIFSYEQTAVLHNKLADLIVARTNFRLDANNITESVQAEGTLNGQIELLQDILELSRSHQHEVTP